MNGFELHLRKQGLADNTVKSYLYGTTYFLKNYELRIEDFLEYKGYLLEHFKPKTVNLRIQGINNLLIPMPPLEEQSRIIQEVAKFEDLIPQLG